VHFSKVICSYKIKQQIKMDIKRNQTILLALIVFVAVLFFGLSSIGSEDEWICKNGQWVKDGNPKDPKPVFDCKKTISDRGAYDVYCEKNDDCSCGAHVSRNVCFIGNKRYIDPIKKCDRLCESGIKLQCVKNQCKQIK